MAKKFKPLVPTLSAIVLCATIFLVYFFTRTEGIYYKSYSPDEQYSSYASVYKNSIFRFPFAKFGDNTGRVYVYDEIEKKLVGSSNIDMISNIKEMEWYERSFVQKGHIAIKLPRKIIVEESIQEVDTSKTNAPEENQGRDFKKIIDGLKIKSVPLVDSTNYDNLDFDSFKKSSYDKNEVGVLQLEKLYPNYFVEGYNYRTSPSYRLVLSEKFYSIVLTVFRGDHEMESVLINYGLNGSLIDSKVIAYDEIAEGWSRIESKIEKKKLTISNILWIEEKQEEIKTFTISSDGKIKTIAKVSPEKN